MRGAAELGWRGLLVAGLIAGWSGPAPAYHAGFTDLAAFTVLAPQVNEIGTTTVSVHGEGSGLGLAGTPGRTGASQSINGTIVSSPGGNSVGSAEVQALVTLGALQERLAALPPDFTPAGDPQGHVALATLDVGAGAGILIPGVYRFASASLGSLQSIIFQGPGEFVLNVDGDLALDGTDSPLPLTSPANVLWNVGGDVTLHGTRRGHFLAEGRVLVTGDGTSVAGKLFSRGDRVDFDAAGGTIDVHDTGFPPVVTVDGAPEGHPVRLRAPLGQSRGFTVLATDPEGQATDVERLGLVPGLDGASSASGTPTAALPQTFTPQAGQLGSSVLVFYRSFDVASTVGLGQVQLDVVLPEADLSVSVGAVLAKGGRNEAQASYTATVANAGPETAENVVLTDPLPPGTTFLEHTASQGSCLAPPAGSGGTLTCSLGALGPGASATVTLKVRVSPEAPGTRLPALANTATVSTDTGDPDATNDSATVVTARSAAR